LKSWSFPVANPGLINLSACLKTKIPMSPWPNYLIHKLLVAGSLPGAHAFVFKSFNTKLP
jgi:hypothetical protein